MGAASGEAVRLPLASHAVLEWLQPPAAPVPAPSRRTIRSGTPEKVTAYVLAAVTNEHDNLAATGSGRHYATLKAAISLGSLVVSDMLSEDDARDALLAAATTNGYIEKVGRAAVERTIRDGLKYGAQYPRQVEKP